MHKELSKKFIIDGNIVELEHKFCDIEVYQYRSSDDGVLINYYVKNNKVVAENRIEADMEQGVGYICEDRWSWEYELYIEAYY